MSNNFTYYDYRRVLSYNAMWNFIVGVRGNGKTYGAKKRAIKMAIKDDKQFIYLRRYEEEIKLAKNAFFADIDHEFPNHDFRVNGYFAECAPVSTRDQKKRQWKTIGYFIALSRAQQYKSVSFPKVHNLIYDEFIIEKGYIRYLPDEHATFINFYLTVDRYQGRVKAFFLANTVSINNPYFLEYEIRPDEIGEFTTMKDNFLVVHLIESADFKSQVYETRFGKFIAGTQYADYAVEAEFSDNHSEMVDSKPSTATYRYSLEVKGGVFSVWIVKETGEYYVQKNRPKQEMLFTLLPERMTDRKKLLLRSNKILQYLRASFSSGRMFFDNQQTRNIFIEVFK